jgi:hypothetical protein
MRGKGRPVQSEERGPLVFKEEEESPNVLDQSKKVTFVAILGAFKPDILLDTCVKVHLPAFDDAFPQIILHPSDPTPRHFMYPIHKNTLQCYYDEDRRVIYVCLASFRNALADLSEPSAPPEDDSDPYATFRFKEDTDALMLLLLLLSCHVVLLRSTSHRFDPRLIRLLRAARATRAALSRTASGPHTSDPRGPAGEPGGPLRPLTTPVLGFAFPSIPGQEDAQPVSKALEKALDAQARTLLS